MAEIDAEQYFAPRDLSEAFRGAMRNLATTVTLVTARDEWGRHGIAASAVISVTAEPPTLLVSVIRAPGVFRPVTESGRLCANIMGHDQADLLLPFASSDLCSLRFTSGAWFDGPFGLPYLSEAVASIFCTVVQKIGHSTHCLFLGEVNSVVKGRRRAPLVWYDGAQADLERAPRPRESIFAKDQCSTKHALSSLQRPVANGAEIPAATAA